MVGASMSWRAIIWYGNAILCALTALVTAYTGSATCFAWVVAAWVDWQIGNYLVKKEEDKKYDD